MCSTYHKIAESINILAVLLHTACGDYMPRVTIYIDNRMYGALEVIATQRGLEIRELIKEIIKKYVENYIKQCKK